MAKPIQLRRNQGFSLVEVMITIFIVAIVFLGTTSLIANNQQYNYLERERQGAQNRLAEHLEAIRATPYLYLAPYTEQVTIWDYGTDADPADDTVGVVTAELFDGAGTAITKTAEDYDLVTMRLTVTWNPRGRRNNTALIETLVLQITP